MKNKTLGRAERLRGDKVIQGLFREGKSGFVYPFRYVYSTENVTENSAMLVSVPKKSFKRAVKRNLLKRRTREAYRLNKGLLSRNAFITTLNLNIAFIYSAKEVLDYKAIEVGMKRIISAIVKENGIAPQDNVKV